MSSNTVSVEPQTRQARTRTPRVTYRISALSRAFLLFWRAALVLFPVILVNTIVQALLTLAPYSPDAAWLNVGLAALSAVTVLTSIAWVTASAASITEGAFGWRVAMQRARQHWLQFGLWAIGLAIVATIGFALWTVPGAVVLALTPFVLVATMTGERHALRANVAVIGRRFWRWLITTVIVLIVALLWLVISGFVDFFLRGFLGGFTVWMVTGFLFTWFTLAYALIYASARGTQSH